MQPIDVVHFLNKGPLTNYGADKVESEDAAVLPVLRHHSSDSDLFATE